MPENMTSKVLSENYFEPRILVINQELRHELFSDMQECTKFTINRFALKELLENVPQQ